MKVALYNQSAEEIGTVELPDSVFGLEANPALAHQAMVAQLGSSRQIIAHAKDRSEVRGGGRKPWRQKGTGRARHGSIRSPIWKGGGVTFGPRKERVFEKKINKKMKRKALFTILSSKIRDNEYLVLDDLKFNNGKTKEASQALDVISTKLVNYRRDKMKRSSVLIVLPDSDDKTRKALRNLPFVGIISAKSLNVVDLLSYKYLLLLKSSIELIKENYKI